MGSVPFTCQRQGDAFVLAGAIDESARLRELVAQVSGGTVVLDLGGISFINSPGVREWVRMQAAAHDAGVRFELRRVAEVLIHQLNVVPAARAASTVQSFFATYMCEGCHDEQLVLVDVETHRAALTRLEAPAMVCRACKSRATLSEAPELYCSFLSGTSPLR